MNLAPAWELSINDQPLPATHRDLVNLVRVRASVDGADELEIQAQAWDTLRSRYRFVGEDLLAPGNQVVVSMGYAGDLHELQRFTVVRHEPDYRGGELPTVKIRAYSAEVRLVETTRPRTWSGPVSDSEIVREIARDAGLRTTAASVEQVAVRAGSRVKRSGESDWSFLRKLAAANGLGDPWVRWDPDARADVLYWRALSTANQADVNVYSYARPSVEFAGSNGLRSFRSELSLAGTATKVEVVGWDPTGGDGGEAVRVVMELTAQGQRTTIYRGGEAGEIPEPYRSPGQLLVSVLEAGADPTSERREVLAVKKIASTEDARAVAQQWIDTRNRAWQTGRVELDGDPSLWIAQLHRIEGLSESESGLWAFEGVEHVMDGSGYSCRADVSRVLEDAGQPVEGAA